jgi:hypothetical protein
MAVGPFRTDFHGSPGCTASKSNHELIFKAVFFQLVGSEFGKTVSVSSMPLNGDSLDRV